MASQGDGGYEWHTRVLSCPPWPGDTARPAHPAAAWGAMVAGPVVTGCGVSQQVSEKP